MMLMKFFLAVLLFTAVAMAQDEAPRAKDEIEFDNAEEEDKNFDDMILNKEDRPKEEPVQSRVSAMAAKEFETDVERSSINVNLYVKYYIYSDWYTQYYRCCPRSQYYGCRSNRPQRLPCFRNYNTATKSWHWCCPFYPNIYIYNCNCGTCIKQCPSSSRQCFATGRCHRRYRKQRVYAVCYRNGWNYLTVRDMYIPSSCYCRASCLNTLPPVLTSNLRSIA